MRRVDKDRDLRRRVLGVQADGFTLIEMLIALLILSFGLLSAGQLMYVAMSSASLARSKGNASMVAQDKLESLADVFRRNQADASLAVGDHGPEQVQILNPNSGTALNRFQVVWNVSVVPDPRAGKVLNARLVRVTVTPLGTGATVNNQTGLNKTVSVSSIFSTRSQ